MERVREKIHIGVHRADLSQYSASHMHSVAIVTRFKNAPDKVHRTEAVGHTGAAFAPPTLDGAWSVLLCNSASRYPLKA